MATLKQVIKSLEGAVEEGYGDAEVWVCACPACPHGQISFEGSVTDAMAWQAVGAKAVQGGSLADSVVLIMGACSKEDDVVVAEIGTIIAN